jgi:hypothetical protein
MGDAVKHSICLMAESLDAECQTEASERDPSAPTGDLASNRPPARSTQTTIEPTTTDLATTGDRFAFADYLGATAGGSEDLGSTSSPALGVPSAPAPPPPPPDNLDGSGEFDSTNPGFFGDLNNETIEAAALVGADIFDLSGLQDAARHMRHFLDATGKPLRVDPARMLRDVETFRIEERRDRDQMVREVQAEAARRYDGEAFSFTVDDRGWDLIDSNRDVLGDNWFYALGGFSFTHTAAVRVTPPERSGDPPRVRIGYKLHVFDRYNWDKGKAIPGLPVSDDDLQKLHRAGMARDYLVGGSTETQTSTVDADPSADAGLPPPTPPAGRLEGGRADPGRERGSE